MVYVGFDITLIMQVFQFLVIVFLVRLMIVGPIHKTYSARDQKVAAFQEEARKHQEIIEEKRLEYEERLKAARTEITEYQNRLKADAALKAQAVVDKAKVAVAAEKDTARKTLADEKIKVRAGLENQTPELTKQIIGLVTK